jgi:hypothetical protein
MSVVKKRGRKPLKKNVEHIESVNTTCGIIEVNTSCTESNLKQNNNDPHLILHLHMNNGQKSASKVAFPKKSFESSFYEYDPTMNEPVAYEQDDLSSFPEECNYKAKKPDNSLKSLFNREDKPMENIVSKDTYKGNNMNNVLLKELVNSSNWSTSTDYWCQWDCHSFDTQPVGIPVKYKNNKFHVVGCFCSLECAVAYNFYCNENNYNVWENYNLINMLSNAIDYKPQVNAALSRKCLNVFGGNLDIASFREKGFVNKQYNILQYPMVSLVEHVEEICETIPYQKNLSFIPLDKVRIDKIEEANKDRVQFKKRSNLEEKMSLKFTT